jgi:CheY-like chemotaxis protein
MAAILGIVRGHKGAIMIDSTPGEGTRVRVFFPALGQVAETEPVAMLEGDQEESFVSPHDEAPAGHAPMAGEAPSPQGPAETRWSILVVDDEEMILRLATQLVARLGYHVLTAMDGEEAVRVFEQHSREIACVILDLTIPKLDGVATFEALREICPGVHVILSSGYNEQAATQRLVGQRLSGFLQKPYRLQELQAELRRVLGTDG